MKEILNITLFLFLILSYGELKSQNFENVVISSNKNDFTIEPAGDNKYVIVANDNEYVYNTNPELPAIPVKNISVLVPNGAEMVDYHFTVTKELIEKNIVIGFSPADFPTIPSVQTRQNEFEFNGIFPENPIRFLSVSVQRGYTQFNFGFCPFIYNGKNKTLEFISSLNLNINYIINDSKKSAIHPDEDLFQVVKQKIINPERMEGWYGNHTILNTKAATERVDYLIVTNNALKESFTPLIEWKTRKGLNAEVVTVEEIYQRYDEPTEQLKIKGCLLDYYKNHDLKWVLLGGDKGVVPVQYCHNILEKEVNENSTVPTDLFYACLDSRFDWNSHEDEKIGELFWDGHDVTPEVYLSRLPVNTAEETEAIVKKTINYETNPELSHSIGKLVFAGVKLWSTWLDKSDSHHRSEYIYNKYIKNYTNGQKFNFFDTGTDYDEGAAHDVTSSNFARKWNDGFGYLHFAGHGNYQSLIMESGVDFDTNDVTNLNNQVGGVFLTNACWTNAFDVVEPSFSEALIRNPNGGCLAYFGSSRYGFGNAEPSSILGASLRYNAIFMDYIFKKKMSGSMTFGEIAAFTKNEFNSMGITNPVLSYLMYAINPIGDPELPLYKGIPKTFENVRIFEMNDVLYVNTGGVDNGRICITSIDLKDGYKNAVENVSFHAFENLPDQFQITITAPNYKPYIYKSGITTGITSSIREFIDVYPNPARDFIQIYFNFPNGQLQIVDSNGRIINELEVNYGNNLVGISDLPEGFYILNFIVNGEKARFKIVKQNH